ncbi:MAG TPA: acyltransferase [Croceibacterium sp.]|nr:acyltransferase [Croceibacterium sp.]
MMSAPVVNPARRFVALDSLRGLAALAVVLYHVGDFGLIGGLAFFRHSWLLVDFFFVLSGFVIAASYGERLAGGFSRLRFMALRLGRVVPLHLAVVAAFALAELLIFRPLLGERHDLFYLWRGLFLLDGFAEHTGNFFAPVSWSISVEVVLYIAAALLFGRGRWALTIALVLGGAALAALLTQWNEAGFGFLMQRGVLGFGLGVACHVLHRRAEAKGGANAPRWLLTMVELGAAIAVIVLIVVQPFYRQTVVPADLLFAAVVLAFARDGGAISRVLQTRPMVRLGQLSYSIYMTHLILIIALNRGLPLLFEAVGRSDLIAAKPRSYGLLSVELGPLAETLLTLGLVAGVLALSALTWRWIEEPARQWSRRQASRIGGAPAREAVPAI